MECSSFMKEEERKIIRRRIRTKENSTNNMEPLIKNLAMDSVLFLFTFFAGERKRSWKLKIIDWLQKKLLTFCQLFSACKFI